jgi:hypothetical protein
MVANTKQRNGLKSDFNKSSRIPSELNGRMVALKKLLTNKPVYPAENNIKKGPTKPTLQRYKNKLLIF